MAVIRINEEPYINSDEVIKGEEKEKLDKYLSKSNYHLIGDIIYGLIKRETKKWFIFTYRIDTTIAKVFIHPDLNSYNPDTSEVMKGMIHIEFEEEENYKEALKIKELLEKYETNFIIDIDCKRDEEGEILKSI